MDRQRLLVYLALAHNLPEAVLSAIASSLANKQALAKQITFDLRLRGAKPFSRGDYLHRGGLTIAIERAQKDGFILRITNTVFTQYYQNTYCREQYSWINHPKIDDRFVDIPTLVYEINRRLDELL